MTHTVKAVLPVFQPENKTLTKFRIVQLTYNSYAVRLATCLPDQRIEAQQLVESDSTLTAVADWKVHVDFMEFL